MKEIEELKWCAPKEGKLDLTEDDGLEYLVKLAYELWPVNSRWMLMNWKEITRHKQEHNAFYEELNKSSIFSMYSSIVPKAFQIIYFENLVDKSNLEKYQKGLLLDALDQWGIDARKFWYLCLGVKWLTETYQKEGREHETVAEQYSSLERQLSKEGEKILTLKIKGEKHQLEITDPITLNLVSQALVDFENKNKSIFYCYKLARINSEKEYCYTRIIAYFTAIMDHFLMRFNPDDKPAEIGRTKFKNRDLIAWMVYILEIDLIGADRTEEQLEKRKNFNSERCNGKRYLDKLIKDYIDKIDLEEHYISLPPTDTSK